MTTTQRGSRPIVLRCATSSDFLATLPYMMGYTARNSIVVALFDGSQARQAMRIDLPEVTVPHGETDLDRVIVDVVSRIPRLTSVALVAYTDELFPEHGDAPRLMLMRWLERSLERAGIPVRDVCCVAANAWASLHRPEARTGGRPLRELSDSMAGFEARRHVDDPLLDVSELGSLPLPSPSRSASLERAIELHLRDRRVTSCSDDVVELLRDCVAAISRFNGTDSTDDASAASLVLCTLDDGLWFLAAFACCLDASGQDVGRVAQDAGFGDLVAFIQDPAGLPEAEELAERLVVMSSADIQPVRLRTLTENVTRIVANTPHQYSAGVRQLAAWLWWMGGLLSPAMKMLGKVDANQGGGFIDDVLHFTFDSGPPLWMYTATE